MIYSRLFEDSELTQLHLQGGVSSDELVLSQTFTHLDTLTIDFNLPVVVTVTFALGALTELRIADLVTQIRAQTLAAGAQVDCRSHKNKLLLVEHTPALGVQVLPFAPGVSTATPFLGLSSGRTGTFYNSDFATTPYYLDLTVDSSGVFCLLTEE